MNRKTILFICFFLVLSCTSIVQMDNDVQKAKKQYEHFLNDYFAGGDVSNIDSALKYNAVLLGSDSASIVQYLNQIQLLYLCGRYDSILSFVNCIPQDMVSLAPGYKTYLWFKCKAIMAKESGDISSYRNYLDSIIIRWEPLISDSLERCEQLCSTSIDSVPSHLWFIYENYYEVVSHIHGQDFVEQILSSKKTINNWDNETYELIKQNVNGDAELSLP